MSSIRQLRVAKEIFKILSEALVTDDLLMDCFIDLSLVDVYFLQDSKTVKITWQNLNKNQEIKLGVLEKFTPYIRKIIANRLNLKRTPNIIFSIINGK